MAFFLLQSLDKIETGLYTQKRDIPVSILPLGSDFGKGSLRTFLTSSEEDTRLSERIKHDGSWIKGEGRPGYWSKPGHRESDCCGVRGRGELCGTQRSESAGA